MNCIFFVSLFLVSISGLPLNQNLVDPVSFLSTNAEGGGVDAILDMIAQLRADNTEALNHATDVLNSAQSTNDEKADELTSATGAEDLALGNVDEQEKLLVELKTVAAGATAVEADAKAKKDSAQEASNQAADFLNAENIRLDDERATLEEVIEKIDALAEMALDQVSSSRNLLSIVDLSSLANADPASVAEVKRLINDLIDVGESERASAVDADSVATNNLVAATDVHETAWVALANALGSVDFNVEKLADLKGVATAAVAAKHAALQAFNSAAAVLVNALSHFETETTRVEGEEAVFVEVSDLLATLS